MLSRNTNAARTALHAVQVAPGSVLVEAGASIPGNRLPAVAALRTAEHHPGPLAARLLLALSFLFLLVVAARPLAATAPQPGRSWSLFILFVGLCVAGLWAVRLLSALPLGAAPVALAGLLGSLTLSRRAGLLAAAATVLLSGVSGGVALAGHGSTGAAALAVGAFVAAGLTWPRRTATVLPAALAGAAVQAGVALLGSAAGASAAAPEIASMPGWLLGSAGPLAAGGLALVIGPLGLRWAGRASAWRARRLSRPDHPLLVELRRRAPGTFLHSVRVAQLAEAGARALGADATRCRLGGLYHDLGKLLGPGFFRENHLAVRRDPLSELGPAGAARRIRRHVPDGLCLAARYRLPAEVRPLIAEHHGTTPVRSLLPSGGLAARLGAQIAGRPGEDSRADTACSSDDSGRPDSNGPQEDTGERAPQERDVPRRAEQEAIPVDLRYPGPLPQSPESAILLVSDAAEAATRSLSRPGLGALGLTVEAVMDRLMTEGQFAACGLGTGDLLRLQVALVATLRRLLR